MAQFTSDDLAFTGYSQTTSTTNSENNTPVYLDKTDEIEVISFCNQFLETYKVPKTKASFQKVEYFLQHDTLKHQVLRAELFNWIASNWIKM